MHICKGMPGQDLAKYIVSELALASIWPARLKEGKKNCQYFHSQRELLQIPANLAYALKLVDKSPFIYNPGAFHSAIFVLGLGRSDMAC